MERETEVFGGKAGATPASRCEGDFGKRVCSLYSTADNIPRIDTAETPRSAIADETYAPDLSHLLRDMRRKLSAVVSRVEKKSSMHPNWGINFLLSIIQCVRAVLALIGYMGWKRAALKLIRNSAPDAVILFEENAEGLSCVMAGVARQAGVPYLIIPQTIPNPDEPAHFYRTSPQHDGERALAKILTRFMPQWQFTYQGRRLLRQPIPKILAQQLLGVAPDRPWFLNSGRASAICVECEALRRQYIALGFPPAQLVVIGHPIDDTLHAISLRRKEARVQLEQELGLFRRSSTSGRRFSTRPIHLAGHFRI